MARLLPFAGSIAAFAFAAAPASADHGPGPNPPGRDHPGFCRSFDPGRHHGGPDRDRRFFCAPSGGGWAYSDGTWALYNNRSWEPDSYNDWWHDRPDRAYPRWVQEQRGGPCELDRMWWSGTGWHC